MSPTPDEPKPVDPREFGKEVGHKLLGTCRGIYEIEGAEEMQNSSMEFCLALDEVTMCCVTCGWWTEADDVDDEGACSECNDDTT